FPSPPPPRPPRSTLFPYTTLFRSWLVFIGMNVTFMPMHLMGMLGMPRRIYTYQPQYAMLNHIASAGAAILGVAMLIFVINMLLRDRKSTRLNSSHVAISYAVFCLR